MKTILILSLFLGTQLAFAKKYGCNIQKIPMGKTITQKENHKYIKTFNFEAPIKTQQEFEFKNVVITLHKSTDDAISISFRNTAKDYQISTEFKQSQEIIRINTDGDEVFICWSEKASQEATEEKF